MLFFTFFFSTIFAFIYLIFNFAEEALERDKFMSPHEAKDFGVIDHVVTRSTEGLGEPII